VCREVEEETGVEVEVEHLVGEYTRTGFRPHTARVWRCRAVGGEARPSPETPAVAWFPVDALPATLFPWYRQPLADATADLRGPVHRLEHWGAAAVLAGLWIDLRMRASGDRAG
jgi:ADP-ribose pyrophosphatase YjhB (NUDIX family)